jgi:O-antigen chain-terminating methyltransferase
MMAEGVRYDARRIIRDVLGELCALESAGLFHDDVRVWNVLVAPDGSASLLDFGAISAERRDCAWPDDPLLSFWIFVHDVATAKVERILPQRQPFMSPLNLPADLRDWALTVWDRPVHDWSYRLFLECLDQTSHARATAYASAAMLWMAAIEKHVDAMAARIRFVEARAEEHLERLARVGATLLELEDARQRASAQNAEMAAHHELLVQRVEAARSELAQSSARDRELLQALAEARSRVASLAGELSAANAAYLSIEQSRSWRITKPLRLAKRALRHAWNWLASQLRAIVHP